MRIASTGLSAERLRTNVIAENLANANVTRTPEGGPYRRKMVVFEPLLQQLEDGSTTTRGVRVAGVVPDMQTPLRRESMPEHPDRDADGMVSLPNVNAVREMADLITAMRAYQSHLTVKQTLMGMAEKALELAR